MGWISILISACATAVAVFTAWQGARARDRAEDAEQRARNIEQQKVDAQAYREAQETYRNTIAQLRDNNQRLAEEIKELRKMAHEDRANLEFELAKAHEERGIMERYLRGRITKLESALRDSGIPIPDEAGGIR